MITNTQSISKFVKETVYGADPTIHRPFRIKTPQPLISQNSFVTAHTIMYYTHGEEMNESERDPNGD